MAAQSQRLAATAQDICQPALAALQTTATVLKVLV
jgi:hypothetical protein